VAAERLRLDCLGSGFAFSHGRYWSGFLLDGRILLDCPPQTLPHLQKLGVSTAEVDLVLLSHEHSDHIGGVDLFLLEAMQGAGAARGRPLAVAGPPGIYARLRAAIGPAERLPERDDERIHWFERPGGAHLEWAGVRVDTVAMEHAEGLLALGFRVHYPGGLVAYSGDTRYCEALLRLGDGADLLIVECGGDRSHGHMAWDDVRTLRAELASTTRILVTHYDPDAIPADLPALEGVALAEDFGVYEI
jgi:ribonuclease BN (tRNA processing enzyme)